MASVRLATAKLLRIRVLDAASVLAATPSQAVQLCPPAQFTRTKSPDWQSMVDSIVADTSKGNVGERILVVPRATAEEILGAHSATEPALHIEGALHRKALTPNESDTSCEALAQSQKTMALSDSGPHSIVEIAAAASVPLKDVASFLQGGDMSLQSLARTPPAATLRKNKVTLSPAALQLFDAAGSGSLEFLQSVLKLPEVLLDINAHHPDHGGTCLHIAAALASSEAPQMVDELCKCGALVDARATNNSTPLHWAAGAGNCDVVSELLRHGADATAVSYTWKSNVFGKGSGQTPSHWAAESGHSDCVQVLLDGATPLAAFFGDERGQLPEDLAQKEGHYELSESLQSLASCEMVCIGVSTEASVHRVLPAQTAEQNGKFDVISTGE